MRVSTFALRLDVKVILYDKMETVRLGIPDAAVKLPLSLNQLNRGGKTTEMGKYFE